MTPDIEHFAAQCAIDPQGRITFRGAPVQASSNQQADLQTRVTEFVYKYFYTHPSGHIGQAFQNQPPDTALIARLSDANATKAITQRDWVVRSVMDTGAVIAERYGVVRKFAPGLFLADPDMVPLRAGCRITATHHAGSQSLQPGFYHIFSQAKLDMAEVVTTLRFYVNIASPDHAAKVAKLLSTALNDYQVPFTYKTATRLCDYSRADTAVLYIPDRMFSITAEVLRQLIPTLTPFLDPHAPSMTKLWGQGIGFAQDPATGASFGASRSEIIAHALIAARSGAGSKATIFASSFADQIKRLGLNADALHLNAGHRDIYELPRPVKKCAA